MKTSHFSFSTIGKTERLLLFMQLSYLLSTSTLALAVLKVSSESNRFQGKISNFSFVKFGVVFPPYHRETSELEDTTSRQWFQYPKKDIEELIETAARLGFRRIVTQDIVRPNGKSDSDISDLTGYFTALFNAKRNHTAIKVSYGVAANFHLSNTQSLGAVRDAIFASKIANLRHNGTVESVVLEISSIDNNCFVPCDSDEDCDRKLTRSCLANSSSELINEVADLVHKEDLKFGVRSNVCKYYFQNYQENSNVKNFAVLLSKIDFFICSGPQKNIKNSYVDLNYEARSTARKYCLDLVRWTKSLNLSGPSNNLRIDGEIGWRSENSGSFLGGIESFEIFWRTLSSCSSKNNLKINMFNIVDDEVSKKGQRQPQMIKTQDKLGGYGILKVSSTTNKTGEQLVSREDPNSVKTPETISTEIPGYFQPNESPTTEDLPDSTDESLPLQSIILIISLLSAVGFVVSILAGLKYNCFSRKIIDISKDKSLDTELQMMKKKQTFYEILTSKHFDNVPRDPNFKINVGDEIGSGNFSTVYNGHIKTGGDSLEVAVKIPNIHSYQEIKALLNELKTLSTPALLHDHVCQMLMHVKMKGFLWIALELCENGSLTKQLERLRLRDYKIIDGQVTRETHSTLVLEQLLERLMLWCKQIASGMEHLETLSIIHADLSARNILLDSRFNAKISDFGLSRKMYYKAKAANASESYGDYVAWQWASYETLTKQVFSTKSDVWSFGMTLVEIFSLGHNPIPDEFNPTDLVEKLEEGWRPENPLSKYTDYVEIYSMMQNCWKINPEFRPPFKCFRLFFEGLLTQVQAYPT